MLFKFTLLAFALQIGIVSLIEAKTVLEQKLNSIKFSDDVNTTSACGGIINLSSGEIRYKQFATVEPNERCVWILSPENTTGFVISIEQLGIPSSLSIACLSLNYEILTTTLNEGGVYDFPNASVAIITFYTSSANFRNDTEGFHMIFGALDNGRTISPFSTNLIATGTYGLMKHPNGRETYDNHERSVFVITPIVGVDGKFQKTNVAVTLKQLRLINDYIIVYTFNVNSQYGDKWWWRGRIHHDMESELISNSDLIMLIFLSDSTNVGSGFHIYTHSTSC